MTNKYLKEISINLLKITQLESTILELKNKNTILNFKNKLCIEFIKTYPNYDLDKFDKLTYNYELTNIIEKMNIDINDFEMAIKKIFYLFEYLLYLNLF